MMISRTQKNFFKSYALGKTTMGTPEWDWLWSGNKMNSSVNCEKPHAKQHFWPFTVHTWPQTTDFWRVIPPPACESKKSPLELCKWSIRIKAFFFFSSWNYLPSDSSPGTDYSPFMINNETKFKSIEKLIAGLWPKYLVFHFLFLSFLPSFLFYSFWDFFSYKIYQNYNNNLGLLMLTV